MGTILLSAELDELTPENIEEYDLSDLGSSEFRQMARDIPGMRAKLVSMDLTMHMQYYLGHAVNLTKDECLNMVLNCSTEVWDGLICDHNFSSEELAEMAPKIASMSTFTQQRNLTPALVSQYYEKVQTRRLFRDRERFGDIRNFLVNDQLRWTYINTSFEWNMSSTDLKTLVANTTGFEEGSIQKINTMIDEFYAAPVNRDTIQEQYTRGNLGGWARYGTEVILQHWDGHHRNESMTYANWAVHCQRQHSTALPKTYFEDFLVKQIGVMLGYN